MHDTNGVEAGVQADPVGERMRDAISRLRERMAPVDAWIRTQASERPLVAVAGAVGIGYLLGRLIRRVT